MRREVLSEKKGSPFHSGYTWEGRVHEKTSINYDWLRPYFRHRFVKWVWRHTLIYGATKERAFSKLQSILDRFQYDDVHRVMKSRNEFIVELKNGDVYKAIVARDYVRGFKWDYAIIDNDIEPSVRDNIIFPSFKMNIYDSIENHYSYY